MFFSKTALTIFLKLCMMLDIDKVKNSDAAGFSEKMPVFRKIAENWSKLRFFGIFSETTIEISSILLQNVEENDTEQTQKTAALNLFKKSRYLRLSAVFPRYPKNFPKSKFFFFAFLESTCFNSQKSAIKKFSIFFPL